MEDIKVFQARNLKTLLEEQDITQKELAEMLGFSTTSVNHWVLGKAQIRESSAKLIHDLWPEYPIAWLQGAEDRACMETIDMCGDSEPDGADRVVEARFAFSGGMAVDAYVHEEIALALVSRMSELKSFSVSLGDGSVLCVNMSNVCYVVVDVGGLAGDDE